MSAHEHVRKLLDQLMGTSRDGENKETLTFTDSRVCRAFLTGLCPHDLFTNTKMDIGECSKVHSLALRADYEKAAVSGNYEFEVDALEQLLYFIKDCDRKIQIAKRRLAETQTDLASNVKECKLTVRLIPKCHAVSYYFYGLNVSLICMKPQSLIKLEGEINEKLKTVESLGAEGKIEESMAVLAEIEIIKQDARKEEEAWLSTLPSSAMQQQKLRVCEVCAAYLGLYDNDQRLADHFGGKLHMGFIRVRQRLKELQEIVGNKDANRDKQRRHRNMRIDNIRTETDDRKNYRRYQNRDDALDRDSRRRRSRSRSSGEFRTYHSSRDKKHSSHNKDKQRSRKRTRSRSRSYDRHRHY
ncbi:putative RNA-binding protein Luc7-like 2 [Trichoplax sp. H2]|nr:putative RNA-binding protein Luc7-like 2 [Trichoplax sp. H2]|eukprot:RDD36553.1 putative RNA-binding protein Luc7-like 2 [Trichoplax sp. H2]